VIMGSIWILPSMYQSTMRGVSVRPGGRPRRRIPSRTRPVTTWKGPGGDLLAGLGHANDDALAPAPVAGFQRLAHDGGVAVQSKVIVGAAVGEGARWADDVAADGLGLTKWVMPKRRPIPLCCPLMSTPMILSRRHLQAWMTVSADAAEPNTTALAPGSTWAVLTTRADPGGDAAADVAGLVEGRRCDLGQGRSRADGVVGEGRAAHVMVDRRALVGERLVPSGSALALGGADGGDRLSCATGNDLPARHSGV